ncbi:MAG: hypothetical protein II767_02020, partial [Proteobacteria bacterium]|nr:hypothetical protein [Pseudomonadota bacterium]
VDSFAAKGIAGTPGAGGAGGDNSKLQIAFEVDDRANVYLETQTKITVIPIDPVTHKPLPSEERWIQTTDGADGKAGKSGGGGSGGNVYQCMDQKSYDDFWVFAGSGGAGGCGGHGGKAGGTGGSSIGMVLTPPSDGSVANISLNESKVTSTGGSGGAGQSGQMGHAGGQGGLFYGYAYHKTIDGHCHKATAGGAGAGGGGGGGGAGGRAGHAYGFVFMCNRKETAEHKPIAFDSLASMSECGFNFPGFVKNSKGFSTVTAQNDLKNGSAGSAGTITKAGVGLTGEATRTSTGGEQGTGGSEETQSDREVAKHFVLLKQDF